MRTEGKEESETNTIPQKYVHNNHSREQQKKRVAGRQVGTTTDSVALAQKPHKKRITFRQDYNTTVVVWVVVRQGADLNPTLKVES